MRGGRRTKVNTRIRSLARAINSLGTANGTAGLIESLLSADRTLFIMRKFELGPATSR